MLWLMLLWAAACQPRLFSRPIAEQRQCWPRGGITDIRAVRPQHHGLSTMISACSLLFQLLSSSNLMTRSVESFMTSPRKEQETLCGRKHRDLDLHLWKNGPSRLPPPECSAWTTVVLSGLEYHNLQTVLTAEPLLPWKAFCPQQYWREMTALQVH